MCPVQTVTHVSGRSSFQINGLQPSFLSRHPQLWNIWERLEKESLLDSQLHAGVCLESHACKTSAWFRRWHIPIAAARSWRARRYRAGPKRGCDAVDATLLAQVLSPLPPASARVPEDYSRGAVRPTGSGRVSLPRSIWRRTSCDALPRVCVSVDLLGWCEYCAHTSAIEPGRGKRIRKHELSPPSDPPLSSAAPIIHRLATL